MAFIDAPSTPEQISEQIVKQESAVKAVAESAALDSDKDCYYVVYETVSGESAEKTEVKENALPLFTPKGDEKAAMGIIKPKPREEAPYAKLVCTEQDKQAITEIIKNMGEHGKFWLLRHKSYMNELGDSIRHVHPLKFLEVVFNNDYLKVCMREVFDDYFKRNGFMDGLGGTLTNKSKAGELERYTHDFAKSINVSYDSIDIYFQNRDWDGLVRHLIGN